MVSAVKKIDQCKRIRVCGGSMLRYLRPLYVIVIQKLGVLVHRKPEETGFSLSKERKSEHAYKAVARWLTEAEAMTLRGAKRNVEETRPVIQGLTGLVRKKN